MKLEVAHRHEHRTVMDDRQFDAINVTLGVVIRKLDALLIHAQKQELMMADVNQVVSDLTNAVASLGTGFVTLDAAVQAEIKAINDLVAQSGGNLTPDQLAALQAATSNISTITNSMATDAANLTASLPAAPNTPAPAAPAAAPVAATVTPPSVAPVTATATDATPAAVYPASAAPQPASGGNQPSS